MLILSTTHLSNLCHHEVNKWSLKLSTSTLKLMHVCMFGCKKPPVSTITKLKLTNLRPVKTLRSCPLCSTVGGKKGKQQANKGNIQVSHFSKEGKLTVRWGNSELRREDIFWSNAIVQPEVTDSHFGTKKKEKKKINTELDTHIFNTWHEWKMCIEYNKRLWYLTYPQHLSLQFHSVALWNHHPSWNRITNNLQWLR